MRNPGAYLEDHLHGVVCRWKKYRARHQQGKPIAEVFTDIYHRNAWADSESRSGTASSLLNTAAVRAALPVMAHDLGIRSLLDIPCGDFHWMKEVTLDLDSYVGADVVPELIDDNKRFADGIRSFILLDITSDPLPAADLVLCRDCLIHFSFEHIFKALENIKASGSSYLLTTTFLRASRKNADIATGQWRPLNLERPPFSFAPPLFVIREGYAGHGGRYDDRSLALWRIAEL